MPSQFRNTRAFTLVELLVVVAIISVLIAMLLPALAAAKAQAVTVRCANSVRGCVVGFKMYANDWQDYITTIQDAASGQHNYWPEMLSFGADMYGNNVGNGPIYVSPKLLLCPASVQPNPQTEFASYAAFDIQGNNDPYFLHYNPALIGNGYDWTWDKYVPLNPGNIYASPYMFLQHINQITTPSDLVLLGDSLSQTGQVGINGFQWCDFEPHTHNTYGWAGGIQTIHGTGISNEKANCGFYDGHVEALTPAGMAKTLTNITCYYDYNGTEVPPDITIYGPFGLN